MPEQMAGDASRLTLRLPLEASGYGAVRVRIRVGVRVGVRVRAGVRVGVGVTVTVRV